MANRKIYQVKLEDISQNGTLCQNPTVEFEKPYCTDIRCYTEQSNGDYLLKIEVPEDCPDPCVYAIIDCADDCGECEPERVQICPCTEDADCPDCQECVDNLCVTTCADGQFCSGGDCVDCDDDNPCPCNQVCVNGDCQCPPSKPYIDSRGCCTDCSPTVVCPPCYVCTVDGCEPIVCPEGVCDPETSNCVECLGSGDCTGDNECCVDKVCDCCFGFVRDPETQECVPDPGCISDSDCPECEICTETGCEPQTCPAGYVYTGTYPCCLKECDCDSPDCPGRQNCVIFDDTTCVCTPCIGACDGNEDCGDGCYCNNGQCTTNPCYGWCFDGTDCADGCGCVDGRCLPCDSLSCGGTGTTECEKASGCGCDNNDCIGDPDGCIGTCLTSADCGDGCGCYQENCVPCSQLSCDECKFALGCDCVDGTSCEESACKNTCADYSNCPGVDCGCYDGECVECQAYSCENDPCPEGCVCGEDSICYGNPCKNIQCEVNADCGESCSCEEGFCTPCPSDNANCGGEDCGDLLLVGKNDDTCELEAVLTQDACCNCRDIVISPAFELDPGPGDGIINIAWRVGKLADVAHHSTLPEHTTVNDSSGNPVAVEGSTVKIKRYVYKTNGTYSTFQLGATGGAGINSLVLTETEFPALPGTADVVRVEYVLISAAIQFADQCDYQLAAPVTLFSYGIGESSSFEDAYETPKVGADLSKLTPCRSPLFVYRKGTSASIASAATPFAYKYGTSVPPPSPTDQKIWEAAIGLSDGLEYGKYYEVSVDCGCPEPQLYSCYGPEQTPTKLVFCHLTEDDIQVDVDATSNCRNFEFTSDITIDCDVMAGASPQPIYQILVNGAVFTSFSKIDPVDGLPHAYVRAVAGSIPLTSLGTLTAGAAVTSVGLRLYDDTCHLCDVEVDTGCDQFDGTVQFIKDACDLTGTYSVKITTNQGPLVQQSYDVSDSGGSVASGTFYGPSVTVASIPDPVGAEPVTVTVERVVDSVQFVDVQLYDPDSGIAANNLLLNYACSGPQGYVRGTNNYSTSATLTVLAAGTATVLGTANVAGGATGTVLFDEDTLVDITFTLNANPSCAVTETDVVVNCCDDIDPSDIVISHSCLALDTVELTMTNSSAANLNFVIKDSTGATIDTVLVTASGTSYVSIAVESGKTYAVYVTSPVTAGCGAVLAYSFDPADCCTEILDRVVISRECRSGNGPGAVGTLVVTNGTVGPLTMRVYLIVGGSSTLLYSGNDTSFEYTPSTAPSTASIKVAVESCEKTEPFYFNCEA